MRYKEKTVAIAAISTASILWGLSFLSIKLISPSSVSIIVASVIILSLIGERLVFKTNLTIAKILSVIISFIGVYI